MELSGGELAVEAATGRPAWLAAKPNGRGEVQLIYADADGGAKSGWVDCAALRPPELAELAGVDLEVKQVRRMSLLCAVMQQNLARLLNRGPCCTAPQRLDAATVQATQVAAFHVTGFASQHFSSLDGVYRPSGTTDGGLPAWVHSVSGHKLAWGGGECSLLHSQFPNPLSSPPLLPWNPDANGPCSQCSHWATR